MKESVGYQLVGKPALGASLTLKKFTMTAGQRPECVTAYKIEVSQRGEITCACESFKRRGKCKHRDVIARMLVWGVEV